MEEETEKSSEEVEEAEQKRKWCWRWWRVVVLTMRLGQRAILYDRQTRLRRESESPIAFAASVMGRWKCASTASKGTAVLQGQFVTGSPPSPPPTAFPPPAAAAVAVAAAAAAAAAVAAAVSGEP